ncbi:MAG: PHP domain-containing protein [Clostridia bacterium]|nr:PHP domain-containing protein [Clostridia bacterium]
MKAKFNHDLHIHSKLSLCSGREEQTKENILKYAIDNGLDTICITDHFWDEAVSGAWHDFYTVQNFPHISKIKPLPQAEGVRFLFGCETEMDKFSTVAVSKEKYDEFDFIVIPTTHFHMRSLTVAEEDLLTTEKKVNIWLKRINDVLKMDLPFHKVGFAHLTTALIEPERSNLLKFIEAIPEDEMRETFRRVAEKGAGIELNRDGMNFTEDDADIMLKPYRIAKEEGCKFYFGSDAHNPEGLAASKELFERAIEYLNLEDTDMVNI